MYDKISRSLVELVYYNGNVPHVPDVRIPGVIVMSGNDYCYIITSSIGSSIGSCEVILPDKTKVTLRDKDVKTHHGLMAFYVSTSSLMESVKFSVDDVSLNGEVFTVGYEFQMPNCHISPGRVTHARMLSFSHDSPTAPTTSMGDLVFNKEAELVGISFKDLGVTIAITVKAIAKLLSCFHKNMEGKPLSEILQQIDVQARKRKKVDQTTSHIKRKKKSY